MELSKFKLNKKILTQITLLLLGLLIIFFTYFYTDKEKIVEETEKKNALVKVRLCPECSIRLNYHHKRKEVTKKMKTRAVF